MIAHDPVQHAANAARAAALREKAQPLFAKVRDERGVQEAVELAKRHGRRRTIRITIAIDEAGEVMQASITNRPLPGLGQKANGKPKDKYKVGAYYIGGGSDSAFPGIIAGPFDGARPADEGQTLYVYDAKYGLVKVV
jgi:Na+-translocating ferredoxin:NAD+ oxidoreductase RnfG subunit